MISPDGRWWWNGEQWTPVRGYATRYEETPWTRKLQVAVLAVQAIGLAGAAVIVPNILNSVVAASPAVNDPAFQSDPNAVQLLHNLLAGSLAVALVLGLALLAVIVVGVIKLWRWVYWYLMFSYLLAVLSIPSNLSYAFGNGPIRLPAWILLVQLPLALAEIALAAWMVIALRRYGTWARRKFVEPV